MGNIRKTDSKKRIRSAFIQILANKGFDKVSVSEITRLAKINRGTFYLNYIDKFDLLDEIEREFFSDIKEILLQKNKIADHRTIFSNNQILDIIYYLEENSDLISALVNSNLKNEMQEKFKILLTDVFIQLHVNVDSPKIDKDYAFEIYFGSIATIFIFWIQKGMAETPQELLDIINAYRKLAPLDIFE